MEKENPELSTQTGEKRLVIQLSGDTAPSMMAKQGVYRSSECLADFPSEIQCSWVSGRMLDIQSYFRVLWPGKRARIPSLGSCVPARPGNPWMELWTQSGAEGEERSSDATTEMPVLNFPVLMATWMMARSQVCAKLRVQRGTWVFSSRVSLLLYSF